MSTINCKRIDNLKVLKERENCYVCLRGGAEKEKVNGDTQIHYYRNIINQ